MDLRKNIPILHLLAYLCNKIPHISSQAMPACSLENGRCTYNIILHTFSNDGMQSAMNLEMKLNELQSQMIRLMERVQGLSLKLKKMEPMSRVSAHMQI